MFLNNLNDKQKKLFIELAIKAAESNGIVALEEKNLLKCFAIEMNMTPIYHTDRDVESIINDIVINSTEKDLKIILFEVLGIIVSDNVFDGKEKEFVKNIIEKSKLDKGLIDKMVQLLFDYAEVYNRMVEVVFV